MVLAVLFALLPARTATAYAQPAAATASATPSASVGTAQPGEAAPNTWGDISIALTSLTPQAPRPGDTVTVKGTLTNTSNDTISGTTLAVSTGGSTPLTSRAAISQVAARTSPCDGDGEVITDAPTYTAGDLDPGQGRDFTLQIPVDDLAYGSTAGVHEFNLVAQDDDGTEVGITRTFLPWFPNGSTASVTPTGVAALWPVTDSPHLTAWGQTAGDSEQPVFTDDDLAGEFAEGGRLDTVVSEGASVDLPVTWVVDPEILTEATQMTDGYRVAADPGDDAVTALADSTKGTGPDAATTWLEQVKAAVNDDSGSEVAVLPYGDPDLVSLAHNGTGVQGLAAALNKAEKQGAQIVTSTLGVDGPDTTLAWPDGGTLDTQTLDLAEDIGDTSVIVDSDEVGGTYTPDAVQSVGDTTALVAGSALTELLSGDLTTPAARTMAEQQMLAETLMVTLEHPSTAANLVIAPDRQMSAGAAGVLADVLQTAAAAGWADPVTLDQLQQDATNAPHLTVPHSTNAPGSDLSADAIAQIASVEDQLTTLLRVVSAPQRTADAVHSGMLSALSTAWRDDPAGTTHSSSDTSSDAARTYRTNLTASLTSAASSVSLVPRTDVTLAGDSATLPISVTSGLQQPTAPLTLKLTSSQPQNLQAGTDAVTVTPKAGSTATVHIPVSVRANGLVEVTAQLYTPDGKTWGDPMTFTVRVTSATTPALCVIGAGTLFVALAVVRRKVVRRRAH
ncbi:DUF6049 family protein [Streptomyces fractus]|uniref:DUF6049 family protein n=1 Tax=Streptomyces fractus TaxID=641806 RepID=UPI003CE8AA33